MIFLIKNLEEIHKAITYQCINEFGCNCNLCPYYNKTTDHCEEVESFYLSIKKIKTFFEKNQETIIKTLDK